MESSNTKVPQLPSELWCQILSNVCSVRDKVKCRQISKQLRVCVDDSASWMYAYLEIIAKRVSLVIEVF